MQFVPRRLTLASPMRSLPKPCAEQAAEALTWGADEHILCALAASWWLYARNKDKQTRLTSHHVLLTTLVVSALPHLLKTVFNQERPDRLTVRGHWRGVPFSGNRLDALPSGHAVHIGALASAASVLTARQRNAFWGVGSRSGVAAYYPAGSLGQRRRGGPRRRRAHRSDPQALHRLWPSIKRGPVAVDGRSCTTLRQAHVAHKSIR